jgi:hypothetical protein
MKKLFFVSVLIVCISSVQAQIRFGLKAGLNLATVSGTLNPAVTYSMKLDFNGGLLVSIPLVAGVSLQPEVIYSGQGADLKVDSITGKYNFSLINVPVMLKFMTKSHFFAETGPQVGFLIGAKITSSGQSYDVKSQLKTADFAWCLGIGYQLPVNLGIDVRYNLGLTNTTKNSDTSTGGGTVKNGVIQIGVYYLF